ncbi:DegT/DnrJ/EryC1/StrS family aminotransferase [Alphaproteobacteria bacterium]|nr:DegT/DnrJ/EryC1/StrS family aminotransferase [Alphaproteobacteria bacterium]
MKSIPFFDYPRAYLDDRDNLLKIIDDVSSRGAFILQKEKLDFENNLAKFCNTSKSIGVANATDALELAWLSIDLKAGDEIICSSHTMLATASAIITAGGIPVPVDIGNDGLIDPDAIEDAITERTVGIMPTQLNGRTCDMDRICKIASSKGFVLIEDAAQALGSRFKKQFAGTFGYASAISFYPAKVLGCFGDGGAILVNEENSYEKLYQLHDHGRAFDGEVKLWGRNSRLDNLQAAILDYGLKKHDDVIKRRRFIASIYNQRLQELDELNLPPGPSDGDHFDIFQNYELCAQNRDKLKTYLKKEGIGTLVQWGGKGIHQIKELGFNQNLPRTDDFFSKCIMLPMNTFITDEDVHYISDKIINFYRR